MPFWSSHRTITVEWAEHSCWRFSCLLGDDALQRSLSHVPERTVFLRPQERDGVQTGTGRLHQEDKKELDRRNRYFGSGAEYLQGFHGFLPSWYFGSHSFSSKAGLNLSASAEFLRQCLATRAPPHLLPPAFLLAKPSACPASLLFGRI